MGMIKASPPAPRKASPVARYGGRGVEGEGSGPGATLSSHSMVERIRPQRRRVYSTGNAELDVKIADLVAASGRSANADLVQELITAAIKEFAHSFRVFRKWRDHRKVTIFGSARTDPSEPVYDYTRRFAKAMAEHNWMVITGAGPGIMAAGHEGAGAEHSFGASIRLPLESEPNIYIQGNAKL